MHTHKYQVQVFRTGGGKEPFHEWLSSLDTRDRAIVRGRIERVRHGLLGDCKSVGGGVFELRINCGPGYRVYFGISGKELVLLLIGGDKKTQKRDILKAKEFWSEWEAL
jgi:putative addiction module killer protein